MSALTELTTAVKDFNQGITADRTDSFLRKLKRIETDLRIPSSLAPLLKMMRSLGQYLASRQDGIHPDTLPVLFSIAEQFEDMILNDTSGPAGSADTIHGRVSGEISKYKNLQKKMTSSPSVPDTDLSELKSVILSIDWEISDQTMQHFQKIIMGLIAKYEPYKIHHTFLKIMQTIGQYIGSRKAGAHSESISLLNSVLESFESICNAPEMPFRDKKKILEDNISRFQSLKNKISRPEPDTDIHPEKDLLDDEPLAPALSHLKPSMDSGPDDVLPVATLSDNALKEKVRDGSKSGATTSAHAKSDRSLSGPKPSDSTDVMGDLFSVKESPADELLDAIHMMDVHGNQQPPPFPVPETTPSSSSEGIKEFSPQRVDKEPLPEIETRLNAFFNLETEEEEVEPIFETEPDVQDGPELEIDMAMAPGMPPEIRPDLEPELEPDMDLEPMTAPATAPEGAGPLETPFMAVLNRIQSDLAGMDRPWDTGISPSVRERVFELKPLCLDDPEKSGLLDVIVSMMGLLETREKPSALSDEPQREADGTDTPKTEAPPAAREKPSGLLARIKSLFKS